MYEEVDNQWLLPAHFPCTIPTCSLRLKVVEKSGGGIRLLVDSSYPWLEIEGSAVEDEHGLIKPVAPNFSVQQELRTPIKWTSIEEQAHGAQVINDCASFCGVRTVMVVYDMLGWFHLLPRHLAHRWMAIINCMELSAIDALLGMSRSDSAD